MNLETLNDLRESALDWLPFHYTDNFNAAFNRLLNAIDTDLAYVRAHTRLLVRSIEWDKASRDKSLLLRGANLHEAERWLVQAAAVQKPQATALQSQYITISRRDANRRQRVTVAALAAGLIVAVALALLATYQSKIAEAQRGEAKRRLVALYQEQGRQELIGGRPMQALVYLNEALQEGGGSSSLRFMLAHALHNLDGEVTRLDEHTQEVTTVAVSRDDQRIVTGSDDGTANVWDAASGELLFTLDAHAGGVKSVAFSGDDGKILTAGGDSTARVWDTRTGNLLATLSGHGGQVNTAYFSNDGRRIVTASDDHNAAVWDGEDGRPPLFLLRGSGRGLTLAIFSPDDHLILTVASFDGTAKVWNAQTGRLLCITPRIHDRILTASFSPNSKSIVTGGDFDRTVIVWDALSGRQRVELTDGSTAHAGPIKSAVFSHDGKLILTASRDGTAKVWDADTGDRLQVLAGRTAQVNAAAFSYDDKYIVTAGESGSAEVWDADEGKLLATLGGHTRAVVAATFTRSGERIVTAGADKQAIIWNWKAARATAPIQLEGVEMNFGCVAFSPDGELVLMADGYGTGKVWRAADIQLLGSLESDFTPGADLGEAQAIFSPDSGRVLTVSTSGVVRMWETSSRKLVYEINIAAIHPDTLDWAVNSAAFDADGRRFVMAGGDGVAWVHEGQTGKQLFALAGHKGAVNTVAFSPNSARVITASDDGTAKLWDAANGTLLRTFDGHSSNVLSAAFSPDGRRIVTASSDRTAALWDVESGGLLATLDGHTGIVTSAVFSSDGRLVVTASEDRTARIWDGQSGSLLVSLEGHTGAVTSVGFGPEDGLVATASNDATVRIWDVLSGRQLAKLIGHTNRIESMVISPDKTRLVTVSDGTARIWDIHLEARPPNEINALVKRRVPFSIEGGRLLPAVPLKGAPS